MQMYPRDGGYKEQYYEEVKEEYVVHEDAKGSAMHKPGHDQFMHQHHGYGDQSKHNHGQQPGYGYGGHTDQSKHNHGQQPGYGYGFGYGSNTDPLKHDYGQHGYGGHHKNGVESYSAESWCEKEGRDNAWNVGNGYSGHGHNAAATKHNGYDAAMMKHNGYEGHYGPHKEHQYKKYSEEIRAPVWKFKGISD